MYALEGQSVEDKDAIRGQTVELIVVEAQIAKPDVIVRRLAREHALL